LYQWYIIVKIVNLWNLKLMSSYSLLANVFLFSASIPANLLFFPWSKLGSSQWFGFFYTNGDSAVPITFGYWWHGNTLPYNSSHTPFHLLPTVVSLKNCHRLASQFQWRRHVGVKTFRRRMLESYLVRRWMLESYLEHFSLIFGF